MKNDSEEKALEYIKDFSKAISNCESVDDYYNLIIAIFIFNSLVRSHFLDSSGNNSEMLDDLEKIADLVSEKVLLSIENSKKKDTLN